MLYLLVKIHGKKLITYLLIDMPKKLIFVIILGIVLLFYFLYSSIYNLGYNAGVNKISLEREQERIEYIATINNIKKEYNIKEKYYINEQSKIIEAYNTAVTKYEKDIASITSTYDSKLHESNERISFYKCQAKHRDSAKQLAEYTSRLDRVTNEGIPLVKELSAGIRFRDEQIKQLINQNESLKQLTGISNGNK